MRHAPCLLLALAALAALPALAAAQSYPCLAGGGTSCRALIPDQGTPVVPLDSTVTVVASGTCTTQPMLSVGVDVTVLHDWWPEVGITLIRPDGASAVLRTGTTISGEAYAEEDSRQSFWAASLVGGSPAGVWTLRLTDVSRSGYGALDDWTLHVVCAEVPVITVEAVTPLAIESPLTPGLFRVTRSVVTPFPVVVTLLVGGTATPGADYGAIPVTVTIPGNEASVDIQVVPVPDGIPDTPETVDVTVAADPLYTVGTPSSATVAINDFGPVIPALGTAGLAALVALLALVGAFTLRPR